MDRPSETKNTSKSATAICSVAGPGASGGEDGPADLGDAPALGLLAAFPEPEAAEAGEAPLLAVLVG